ncbi:unnamed protein product, partial [Protopolystoma xenopodis]
MLLDGQRRLNSQKKSASVDDLRVYIQAPHCSFGLTNFFSSELPTMPQSVAPSAVFTLDASLTNSSDRNVMPNQLVPTGRSNPEHVVPSRSSLGGLLFAPVGSLSRRLPPVGLAPRPGLAQSGIILTPQNLLPADDITSQTLIEMREEEEEEAKEDDDGHEAYNGANAKEISTCWDIRDEVEWTKNGQRRGDKAGKELHNALEARSEEIRRANADILHAEAEASFSDNRFDSANKESGMVQTLHLDGINKRSSETPVESSLGQRCIADGSSMRKALTERSLVLELLRSENKPEESRISTPYDEFPARISSGPSHEYILRTFVYIKVGIIRAILSLAGPLELPEASLTFYLYYPFYGQSSVLQSKTTRGNRSALFPLGRTLADGQSFRGGQNLPTNMYPAVSSLKPTHKLAVESAVPPTGSHDSLFQHFESLSDVHRPRSVPGHAVPISTFHQNSAHSACSASASPTSSSYQTSWKEAIMCTSPLPQATSPTLKPLSTSSSARATGTVETLPLPGGTPFPGSSDVYSPRSSTHLAPDASNL